MYYITLQSIFVTASALWEMTSPLCGILYGVPFVSKFNFKNIYIYTVTFTIFPLIFVKSSLIFY